MSQCYNMVIREQLSDGFGLEPTRVTERVVDEPAEDGAGIRKGRFQFQPGRAAGRIGLHREFSRNSRPMAMLRRVCIGGTT